MNDCSAGFLNAEQAAHFSGRPKRAYGHKVVPRRVLAFLPDWRRQKAALAVFEGRPSGLDVRTSARGADAIRYPHRGPVHSR
jgi:hypothetical protein